MSVVSRLETRFGLTRGDVTVALFTTLAAIVGFIYTGFVDRPQRTGRALELERLVARHDSVRLARENEHKLLLAGMFSPDSTGNYPPWDPLSEEDGTSDQADDAASGKLTLEQVAPININIAPPELLELLPGVGEAIAERIIAYRRHVPFRSVEDLMNVKGIGEKKLEKMRPFVTVGRVPPAPEADSAPDDIEEEEAEQAAPAEQRVEIPDSAKLQQ